MAAVTPQNGRVAFLTDWDPHTYWELNTTNLGTNYGDDTSGNDDNSAVASGDISTAESYQGMNSQNDPPGSGWFDIYTVTDACALVYIPAGLAHNTVRGLFHNGGGTNAQSGFLRATTTGVEVALCHNTGGTSQDGLIEEIPDSDLPGWFTIGWQFASEGGAQGDMGLWINGVKERNATRSFQLAYGSGDPDFGASNGDEPLAASVRDPASYGGGNWGAAASINSTGVLIANFCCDNPNQTNTTPAGNGDTFYTDYHAAHAASANDSLGSGSSALDFTASASLQGKFQTAGASPLSFAASGALRQRPRVWINDVASKDGNEVECPWTAFSNTAVTFNDTEGPPTGTVYIGVETPTGQLCWSAAQTANAAGTDPIAGSTTLDFAAVSAVSGKGRMSGSASFGFTSDGVVKGLTALHSKR